MNQDPIQTLLSADKFSQKVKTYLLDSKRSSFFLLLIILVAASVVFKISLTRSHLQKDLIEIEKIYEKFTSANPFDMSLLQSLKKMFEKHPEIAPMYEGRILQQWLMKGSGEKSFPYIEMLLKKIHGTDASFYNDFSKITLLIQKNDLEKALAHSLLLKESMIADKSFWKLSKATHVGSYLFAYNLLRIAILCQNLDKGQEELLALKEFKHYTKWDETVSEKQSIVLQESAIEELSSHFTDNQMTLKEYIKHREQVLLNPKE